MSQPNSQIAAFGKIVFVPKRESVPPLPDMNLLFFNEEGTIFPWRAVCIDLEIDAYGNTMDQAWENLKEALTAYIAMEKKAAGDSMIAAAKSIIEAAFDENEQKHRYVDIYRKAKKEYTMKKIESGKAFDPIKEEKARLKKLEAGREPIRSVVKELPAA
jgi:predicted RNase H-like HicB family nuclease